MYILAALARYSGCLTGGGGSSHSSGADLDRLIVILSVDISPLLLEPRERVGALYVPLCSAPRVLLDARPDLWVSLGPNLPS